MRECGECMICCFTGSIPELAKPAHTSCVLYNNGCTVFNDPKRPKTCTMFKCSWLDGWGEDQDRPDKSGIMVSVNKLNGGTFIFAIETRENGIKSNIVTQMVDKFNLPVIVVDHESKPPHDTGDYVILKKSLKKRAKSMKGKFIRHTSNASIYKLLS